jgi:hypothetical protein
MGHEKVTRLPFCTVNHCVASGIPEHDLTCAAVYWCRRQPLHHLWWYILSAFGCCINFCICAMLRTRSTFSWPIIYIYIYTHTHRSFSHLYCLRFYIRYGYISLNTDQRKSVKVISRPSAAQYRALSHRQQPICVWTNSTEQTPAWKADILSSSREIVAFCGTLISSEESASFPYPELH